MVTLVMGRVNSVFVNGNGMFNLVITVTTVTMVICVLIEGGGCSGGRLAIGTGTAGWLVTTFWRNRFCIGLFGNWLLGGCCCHNSYFGHNTCRGGPYWEWRVQRGLLQKQLLLLQQLRDLQYTRRGVDALNVAPVGGCSFGGVVPSIFQKRCFVLRCGGGHIRLAVRALVVLCY